MFFEILSAFMYTFYMSTSNNYDVILEVTGCINVLYTCMSVIYLHIERARDDTLRHILFLTNCTNLSLFLCYDQVYDMVNIHLSTY